MSEPVFHRPLKISLALLIAVGALMATTALMRGVRWVIVVCFVGLAGQLAAIVGTALELIYGVAGIKQEQLRSIGFNPTASVAINLIYSTVGFGLFGWLAWRWHTQRKARASH